MRKSSIFVLVAIFISVLTANAIHAATLFVDSIDDAGLSCGCTTISSCCNLRNAITEAEAGDTITFEESLAESTITLTRGELILDKSLTIDGDLDDDLEPDIEISAHYISRAILVDDGLQVILDGLSIGNAYPPPATSPGAGIYVSTGGTTIIKNCTLFNNGYAPNSDIWNYTGGGIYNTGTLYLVNCRFDRNQAITGGALYNDHIAHIFTTTMYINRAKQEGGAIYNSAGATLYFNSVTLNNNKITHRSGDPENPAGGAIYNVGTLWIADSTIRESLIEDCSTPNCGYFGTGGALHNAGQASIYRTTFFSNSAAVGGGILNNQALMLENSTLSDNRGKFGGGVYHSATSGTAGLDIRNCTFFRNIGTDYNTGGIHIANASQGTGEHIKNTIFSGTIGVPECYIASGVLETNGYNLIEDGSCSPAFTGDPRLGSLQDNGGPTVTHALLADSPAIDAGYNGYVHSGMITDQRGTGFPRIENNTVDIGAFEFPPPPSRLMFPIRTQNGKTTIILLK